MSLQVKVKMNYFTGEIHLQIGPRRCSRPTSAFQSVKSKDE